MRGMQLPLFAPPTDWVMPTELPNLAGAKEIAIDCETKDPYLSTKGAGYIRGDGHVAGYAIAVDGGSWYLPIRHETGPNLDVGQVTRFIRDLCSVADREYIFHNAPYDVGWLRHEGIEVAGMVRDTMVAAPLLDENRFSYSLNNLGRDYLGDRKDERLLREAAIDFGVDAKAELYKLPAVYVGGYAEQDGALTLNLWQHFKHRIIAEELTDIFDLECRVQQVAIGMRWQGVRIDLEYAEKLKKKFSDMEKEILRNIRKEYGVDLEVWSADSVSKLFDSAGLAYPRTATGQPSFTKEWLNAHEHPMAQQVVRIRKLNKAAGTFIDAYLKHAINGRIYPEIHPLRSDEGGTVTGRFSYTDPNLQQVPSPEKDPELAPLVRGLFLPNEGEKWAALDYSSQEPRLLVHYAHLMGFRGVEEFVESYRTDPRTDLHQLCADLVGVTRKQAKTINLGLMYGMGKNKMAAQLGIQLEEAQELFKTYHERLPFVLELAEYTATRAGQKGVVRTLLGRRCRFDLWEPTKYGLHKALPHKEAFAEHGPAIKRAYTYKALNRLIQGSAADQTKKAMVACYEAGHLPLLQVHDELAFSLHSPEQAREIKEIMENCVTLEVPSLVDCEVGPNWGEAQLSLEKAFA